MALVTCQRAACGATFEKVGRAKFCSVTCRSAAWYESNREYAKAAAREYVRKDPQRKRRGDKNYRIQNRERLRLLDAAKYAANPGPVKARAKAWMKAHPEVGGAKARRYRARKLGAQGTCSAAQLRQRVALYGGLCWVPGCGKTYEAIDHVIPLSKGGSNWPSNLRPICNRHNRSKAARHYSVVMRAA